MIFNKGIQLANQMHWTLMLQLAFFQPLIVSLAFVGIGDTT
jgi:hypothetical protein